MDGSAPPLRSAHALVALGGDELLLLGGELEQADAAAPAPRVADVWSLRPPRDDGWALPPEVAYCVAAGRSLVERGAHAALATVPLLGEPVPVPVESNFRLFLSTDVTDVRRVPSRYHGVCAVVDARCGSGGAGCGARRRGVAARAET